MRPVTLCVRKVISKVKNTRRAKRSKRQSMTKTATQSNLLHTTAWIRRRSSIRKVRAVYGQARAGIADGIQRFGAAGIHVRKGQSEERAGQSRKRNAYVRIRRAGPSDQARVRREQRNGRIRRVRDGKDAYERKRERYGDIYVHVRKRQPPCIDGDEHQCAVGNNKRMLEIRRAGPSKNGGA